MKHILLFFLFVIVFSTTVEGQLQMFLAQNTDDGLTPALNLDSYTFEAAYALDVLLYSSYTVTDTDAGSLTFNQTDTYTVRVRRSSDDAVRSFTHTEVSDGTLLTWVGTGNGFVELWYDQSGNEYHAVQTDPTEQPKIVDADTLVVDNGKTATLWEDIVGQRLVSPVFDSTYEQPVTRIAVAGITDGYITDGSASERGVIGTRTGSAKYRIFAGSVADYVNNEVDGSQELWYGHFEGLVSDLNINGVSLDTPRGVGSGGLNQVVIGEHRTALNNTQSIGKIQMLLFSGNSLLADKADIENIINNIYSIY